MSTLSQLQASLRQAGLWLACLFMFVIMLLGGFDAISSYALNAPIPAMLEISETLLSAAVFMVLASAAGQHVRVDILTEKMAVVAQRMCMALALLLGLAVFTAMAWRFWILAINSVSVLESASALIRFPIWPAKLLAAAGVSLAATQSLVDLVVLWQSRGER